MRLSSVPSRLIATTALVLLLALALAGCGGGSQKSAQGSSGTTATPAGNGETGTVAPGYELADLTGKMVSNREFAGKVVILDFWATWCPPCREEIPHFVQLQSKYREQGLVIVGLSLDAGGAKDVAPFAEEHNVNYPMLIGNDETAKAFGGVNSIPTTFVLDRQGKIVKRFVGFTPPEVFEQTIAPLLAATS
jgi:cytochrome c biogenesis protein CcmG/thiol:disulfide interchange protein DsbE